MTIDKIPRGMLAYIGGAVALAIIGILGVTTWALIFREIPKANESAFLILIGVLANNVAIIIGYFYGRNVDDRKNQETIHKLVSKNEQTPTK